MIVAAAAVKEGHHVWRGECCYGYRDGDPGTLVTTAPAQSSKLKGVPAEESSWFDRPARAPQMSGPTTVTLGHQAKPIRARLSLLCRTCEVPLQEKRQRSDVPVWLFEHLPFQAKFFLKRAAFHEGDPPLSGAASEDDFFTRPTAIGF